jgi:prepilin-type N-terminal cleavage/methylation domain-containing protein
MKRGFTLLELAIVMLIISVILASGFVVFSASLTKKQYEATQAKIKVIENAINDYSVAFSRIPCPASLTLTASDANYGVEAANKGTCTGGTPTANYTSSSGVAEGAVPVRELKLPDNFMFDAWGNRFRYGVDPNYTSDTSLPTAVGGICQPSNKAISITGAATSTAAAYVIISHGKNGHGGFSQSGTVKNSNSTNTNEQTNCHCNASATATTNNAIYTQRSVSLSTTTASDNFDDIVVFKEAWQLRNSNSYVYGPACLFVVDSGNNVIRKYDLLTKKWSSITNSFNSPRGLAMDSLKNLYVSDMNNNRVQKYTNSTAIWNNNFIATTTPQGISLDISGNIYIVGGGSALNKYDINGTFQTSYSVFSVAPDVFVDSTNQIYVSDSSTNIIRKYDGTSWSNFTSSGVGRGQTTGPRGFLLDSTNNTWIADYNNNRIQKYDGTNWTVWGGTATGTLPGQFNRPLGIAQDALGNIWVSDMNNNRIQKFENGMWNIFSNKSVNNTSFNQPKGILTSR